MAKDQLSFEDESKKPWYPHDAKKPIEDEHLTIGCFQRIGTALEKANEIQQKIEVAINKTAESNDKLAGAILELIKRLDAPRQAWGRTQ